MKSKKSSHMNAFLLSFFFFNSIFFLIMISCSFRFVTLESISIMEKHQNYICEALVFLYYVFSLSLLLRELFIVFSPPFHPASLPSLSELVA